MDFPWDKIKNDFRGFELLAVEYVQMEHNMNFEKTSETRDGNKDAVAVFINYRGGDKENRSEWWMEAKYSNNGRILDRYRLDPTVVSAIIEKNVKKVIVVTNQDIHSTAVSSLQKALYITRNIDSFFCHKDILEYWLYTHIKVFHKYFPSVQVGEMPTKLTITKDIQLSRFSDNINSYNEPIKNVYLGETITASFSVYSPEEHITVISASSSLRGIRKISPKKIYLNKGINEVSFSFLLNENYGFRSKKKRTENSDLPALSFNLDEKRLITKDHVLVCPETNVQLQYPSQAKIIKQLSSSICSNAGVFNKNIHYIYGAAGVGKSYAVQCILENIRDKHIYVYYDCFTGKENIDCSILSSITDYILFPYLPSKNIDKAFIDSIRKNSEISAITDSYIELCHKKGDNSQEITFWNQYCRSDNSILPHRISSDRILIVIDELDEAFPYIQKALFMLIRETVLSKVNCCFLIAGEEAASFDDEIINKKEYYLELKETDIKSMLQSENILNKDLPVLNKSLYSRTSPIEMFFFLQYLLHLSHPQTAEDISVALTSFYHNELWDIYIKDRFDSCFRKNKNVQSLCNKIYWERGGRDRCSGDYEEENILLKNLLIREIKGRLYPYNDLYAHLYRRAFPPKRADDKRLFELVEVGDVDGIKKYESLCDKKYRAHDYTYVYHCLYEVFKHDTTAFKNLIGSVRFCHISYMYAVSATHYAMDISAKDIWEKLYCSTEEDYLSVKAIFEYRLHAYWELTNTAFEWLQYDDAQSRCNELKKLTNEYLSIFDKSNNDSIFLHNADVIQCMIASETMEDNENNKFLDSEASMKNNGWTARMHSFRIRYALTLMRRKPKDAYDILTDEEKWFSRHRNDSDQNDKYWYWATFYSAYLLFTWKNDKSALPSLTNVLEEIRSCYFNDYRKMLFGTALLLYSNGNTDRADAFMKRDNIVLRKKRPRLAGFYETAMALSYVAHNDYKEASSHFSKAADYLDAVNSYSDITQHNIIVAKTLSEHKSEQKQISIEFAYQDMFDSQRDVIYIDPRCCW